MYLQSVNALYFNDSELKNCLLKTYVKGITSAKQLKTLRCHAYKIQSLEGIEALSELEKVVIIGSDIRDVSPLSRISSLTDIYLKSGNENIVNISSLERLRNLKEIHFPNMRETYCYEAEALLKEMEENIEGNTVTNLNLVHCRGKKTSKVTTALRKQEQGESLTSEEYDALSDYETNLSYSR